MDILELPAPVFDEDLSVREALNRRRSVRTYSSEPLTPALISALLWACDGRTVPWGGRTAPSAGATYPLEIYVVSGRVCGLDAGLYRYDCNRHGLVAVRSGDLRGSLAAASWNQRMLREAPATLVLAAVRERTTDRYGDRGNRYIFMEAGHCGQNVHLAAESLHLGTVMIGAFDDRKVQAVLGIPEEVLYLCPVGKQ